MNLPMRYANFPKQLHDVVGKLVPNKKTIVYWLCERPGLLGWRLDINWLWCSPAGLFGLDQIGSLIIVRIAIDNGIAPNPFEKPAADIKSAAMNRRWSEEAIRAELLKHPCGTSIGRYASDYSSVDKRLKLRERSGNPFPVFFGIVASSRSDFDLSPKARKNLVSLQKKVGDQRAGWRLISAKISWRVVRVQCWTPIY